MRKVVEKLRHGRNNSANDIFESQVIDYRGVRLDEKLKKLPPDIQEQINKIVDGSTSVGVARALYDPTLNNQNNQSFIIRTTGGSASVGTGNAKIKKIYGNSNEPSSISADVIHAVMLADVYNFGIKVASVDDFKTAVSNVQGTYHFDFGQNKWTCREITTLTIDNPTSEVTKYGLKITGPSFGDDFTVTYDSSAENEIDVSSTHFQRISLTYDSYALKDKIFIADKTQPGSTYEGSIIYGENAWRLNSIPVDLSDYGITITLTEGFLHPEDGDQIYIRITRGNYPTITFATPTALKTLGVNNCNSFDPNAMVIKNHTIDNDGNIIPMPGFNVCYSRAVYNEDNESGYAVYDENETIVNCGWCENLPTESTTGIDINETIHSKLNHILFSQNGYIAVACTNINKICIHPSWSGGLDEFYTNYQEYILPIPKNPDGTYNIRGLHASIDGEDSYVSDIIDFENNQYNVYIQKDKLSYVKYGELSNDPNIIAIIHDNEYMYWCIEGEVETYDFIGTNNFFCNDYSIEEFTDTILSVKCDLAYQSNLVDKLRRDVALKSELNTAVTNLTNYINQEINKIKHPFTTITIDQSGLIRTPEDMITGDIAKGQTDTNVVAWIRRNSHAYVCRWNNNRFEAKQLDDLDRTKYADGTDASTDITTLGYDVMMKLPRFWYKSVARTENPGIVDIIFSNAETYIDNTWNEFDGKSFIGVNEAYIEVDEDDATKSKCYSVSGKTPTVNVSQADFKLYARNRNAEGHTGYKIVDYEAHQIMAILGYAYYGNTNIQDICGSGTSSYPKVTGGRNALGMRDTVKNIDGNNGSTNFWGLENWWGDIYEWMDDLKTTSNGPVNLYEYDGTTIKRQIATNYTRSTEMCITKLVFGNKCDVIPEAGEVNSSYNIGFADYGYVYAGAGYVARRSSYAAYAYGGLACLSLSYGASGAYAYLGSRLLYKGDYIIVDNFSA